MPGRHPIGKGTAWAVDIAAKKSEERASKQTKASTKTNRLVSDRGSNNDSDKGTKEERAPGTRNAQGSSKTREPRAGVQELCNRGPGCSTIRSSRTCSSDVHQCSKLFSLLALPCPIKGVN